MLSFNSIWQLQVDLSCESVRLVVLEKAEEVNALPTNNNEILIFFRFLICTFVNENLNKENRIKFFGQLLQCCKAHHITVFK